MGFFRTQQKNSQIHSPKHCYPGSGWDIIREEKIKLSRKEEPVPARSILISDGKIKRLVIYWFHMNGSTITDEFSLKWQQMKSSLLGRPQAAAFIRFSAVIPPGEEDAAKRDLFEFILTVKPEIDLSLERIFKN
jgi:EpsI family protein